MSEHLCSLPPTKFFFCLKPSIVGCVLINILFVPVELDWNGRAHDDVISYLVLGMDGHARTSYVVDESQDNKWDIMYGTRKRDLSCLGL